MIFDGRRRHRILAAARLRYVRPVDRVPPQQLNIACSGAGFSEWMHDTGANGCAQNAYAGAAWRCIEGYCLCQHELNPDTVTSVSACARPSS